MSDVSVILLLALQEAGTSKHLQSSRHSSLILKRAENSPETLFWYNKGIAS
jgi:hypothetical protein